MRQFIRKYEKELDELQLSNGEQERKPLVKAFLAYWQLALDELQLKNIIGKRAEKTPTEMELENLYHFRVRQQEQYQVIVGSLLSGKAVVV